MQTPIGEINSILFLCLANACRSQMAEGFARIYAPAGFIVYSAGLMPAKVLPETVAVMAGAGVDISDQSSKSLKDIPLEKVDLVVSLCNIVAANCPVFPIKVQRLHVPFKDPNLDSSPTRMQSFAETRDKINAWVRIFFSIK